jgi:hypothetical protein
MLMAFDHCRVVGRVVTDGVPRAKPFAVGLEDQDLDVVITIRIYERGIDLLD